MGREGVFAVSLVCVCAVPALRAVVFLLFWAPSVGRIGIIELRMEVKVVVRSKLMVLFAVLLVSVMLVPVMAKSIGPQKAENNPHIMIVPGEGVELLLSNGAVLEWVADTTVSAVDFMHILDASKAHIPNAMVLSVDDLMVLITDPEAALMLENKWGFVSFEVMVELFMLEGFSQEEAEAAASMWPEGVYARFVNVGKNWNS
jgi:hypothetical protein